MCRSQRLNPNGEQPTGLEKNLVQTHRYECRADHREALTAVTRPAVKLGSKSTAR